jgi:hypothetical protein
MIENLNGSSGMSPEEIKEIKDRMKLAEIKIDDHDSKI